MSQPIPLLLTIEFDGGVDLLSQAARLQIIARKHGLKPVWLVGVETLRHPVLLEPLARWQREGEAEIGALLDPQSVPPIVELGTLVEGRHPVLTDYPERVMDEKLAWLTSSIEQGVGRQPVSIRAIRPAVDDRYYAALAKHGFKVDLTVVPHAKIGPSDFTSYSDKAYLTPQGILELPRTARRRKYGAFVEDLLVLPGLLGLVSRAIFPSLRCFRLRRGNRGPLRAIVRDALRSQPDHLDLRIASSDWARGDRLARDLEKVVLSLKKHVQGQTAEEFFQRFKNEQLRKGLV